MTINLERMLGGYRECIAWADCGPDHETHDKEWSDELDGRARIDCEKFIELCNTELPELLNDLAEHAPGYSDERFGHDLWLTRNGHGAGYWDREELNVTPGGSLYTIGDNLSRMAKHLGVCDLYVGDDGKVYTI